MAYQLGDGKYHILWKLVEQEGGLPRPGDSIRDLLAKYLTAIGGTPVQGDHFNNLLAKVVIIKGGTPLPGDHEWDLLRKWLEAEGECRACGDSIHNLWRKILELGESSLPEGPALLAEANEQVTASSLTGYVLTNYVLIQESANGVDGWVTNSEWPIDSDPLPIDLTGSGNKYIRAAVTTGSADPITDWSNVVRVIPQSPLMSWLGPQTFFVSPTIAGGFIEIQHAPDAGGPFTAFLSGIATPGADHTLDFTSEGEPGGLWYRARASQDGVFWSEWGAPAWDDNS